MAEASISTSLDESVISWVWNPDDLDQAKSFLATVVRDMRQVLQHSSSLNLAQHVLMRGLRSRSLGPDFLRKYFAEDERANLQPLVSGSKLPVKWLDSLAHGRTDFLGALVLSRLSGLKILEVYTFDRTNDEKYNGVKPPMNPFGEVFRNIPDLCAGGLAEGVATFKDVELARILVDYQNLDGMFEYEFSIYLDGVLPLFYLPQLQTIELHRIDDGGNKASWPSATPSASKLTSMILKHCQLTEDNLDLILQSSPNLKSLNVQHVLDAEYVREWFDLSKLSLSLANLKSSLEHLSFSLNLWTSTAIDCGDPGDWGIRGSLGSLKDFSRLAHLAISLPVLLGWHVEGSPKLAEVLPDSVEVLTVTNEMHFWWDYLWDDDENLPAYQGRAAVPRWHSIETKLVEYLEGRPAHLKELNLQISPGSYRERAENLRLAMRSVGQRYGVKVDLLFR